jgi:hypothetical protein
VVLACLLLLAGCTAPTATGPTASESSLATQTPTDGSDALPVNESRVYDRVAAMLDTDVRRPSLRTVSASKTRDVDLGHEIEPFHRLLLDADRDEASDPGAYYDPEAHRVTIVLHDGVPAGATNESELEAILAHEYAHAVTYRDERYREPMLQALSGGTTDEILLRRAIVEGSATYVSSAYSRRYLDSLDHGDTIARSYRRGNATERYVRGPYRFGSWHFERRIDDAVNLTRVYRTPPETTEQLVHGYAPGDEPPRDVTVSVEETDSLTAGDARDTVGELFVRNILGTHLSESRATDAARGWGNDRVVPLWDYTANESNQRNYLWVLRWDDERNATEFQNAFTAYLDQRGNQVDDQKCHIDDNQFKIERVDEETVSVLIGGPRIIQRTNVSGRGANVSVSFS